MVEVKIKLTNVVQVMLRRRVLPCQHRNTPMWSYKSEDPTTMQYFFGTTHDKVWKLLFKP